MDKITYKELLNSLESLPDGVLKQEVLFWDRDEGKVFAMCGMSAFDERYAPDEFNTFYLDFHSWKGWN